ncbi:MAG: ribonuclease P protein component [Acholeplasmataceae bacterium]
MKKEYRVKKSSEIDAIFKHKKSKNNQWYGIHQKKSEKSNHFRFSLSIGKKYGNAVERNLSKRRLRMIILELSPIIKNNIEFVVVIKPASKSLSFQEMRKTIIELLKKSNLLENENAEH